MENELIFLDNAGKACIETLGIELPESALLQAFKKVGIEIMISNGRKFVSKEKFRELMPEYLKQNAIKYKNRRRNISMGTQRFYKIQRTAFSFLEEIVKQDPAALNYFTFLVNRDVDKTFKQINVSEAFEYIKLIRKKQELREDRKESLGSRFVSKEKQESVDFNVRPEEEMTFIKDYRLVPQNLDPYIPSSIANTDLLQKERPTTEEGLEKAILEITQRIKQINTQEDALQKRNKEYQTELERIKGNSQQDSLPSNRLDVNT